MRVTNKDYRLVITHDGVQNYVFLEALKYDEAFIIAWDVDDYEIDEIVDIFNEIGYEADGENEYQCLENCMITFGGRILA